MATFYSIWIASFHISRQNIFSLIGVFNLRRRGIDSMVIDLWVFLKIWVTHTRPEMTIMNWILGKLINLINATTINWPTLNNDNQLPVQIGWFCCRSRGTPFVATTENSGAPSAQVRLPHCMRQTSNFLVPCGGDFKQKWWHHPKRDR